jgi:CRP-like cAMP-binding protein
MNLLIRKTEQRDHLSLEEKKALEEVVSQIVEHPARKIPAREKVEQNTSTVLLEGIVGRYKDLPDGQRQILGLHVPGDFFDLHSFLLKKLDHNIAAISPVRIALVPHDRLRAITESFPHLARLLWFNTLMDAAAHREWILSVGRRSAIGRLAHLFCELLVRLKVVGLADDSGYPLPITQIDLADSTGLTPVHVNRMLRQLRDTGILSFREGRVVIHDLDQLHQVAAFDSDYLFMEQQPR